MKRHRQHCVVGVVEEVVEGMVGFGQVAERNSVEDNQLQQADAQASKRVKE